MHDDVFNIAIWALNKKSNVFVVGFGLVHTTKSHLIFLFLARTCLKSTMFVSKIPIGASSALMRWGIIINKW